MKPIKDILVKPVLSEKSSKVRFEQNQYVFAVNMNANKREIKKAVETRFSVIVEGVRTLVNNGKAKNVRGVAGHTSEWKKAFVSLRQGDKINEFEGA